MERMTYRTQNHQRSLSSVKGLFVLMVILAMPMVIVLTLVINARKTPRDGIDPGVVFIAGVLVLLFLLPWLYYRGFRNLTFALDDGGITIRFLRTLHITWSDIVSIQKVRPAAIVGMRLCGLGWTVTHGLFSTQLGRAWLWLADEPDALFLKTLKRNYLFAPERLDEFYETCQSRIRP
ncbi:MAG: PH domain-containing protein [bacterium]|nr:PH domain-containing protein [bacterium]